MPKRNLFIIIAIISIAGFTCFGQTPAQSNLLEGKWRIDGWTYMSFVGRGLDKSERQHLSEGVNGLMMEFSSDHIFSTNKPEVFGFSDVKYDLEESKYLVCDNYVGEFVIHDHNVFYIHSNLIFKLEKVEDVPNAKIHLGVNEIHSQNVPELTDNKMIPENDTYLLRELDVLPILKE
ncbi:hypothetical protein [Fulvivirga sediminis]|uniref:Lipocalin-like domain-containing protein n=1 Tax=Fulvivirga sediminis TaxID=2803949 RepID=A0A937K1P9_9BACT|nr:hypothetical protein [Fulvivirga sediminis]MBL3656922.1 hypothetical protein [Fulvivirga sediminis]